MFVFCCLLGDLGSGSGGGKLCVGDGGDGKWSGIVWFEKFIVGVGWRLLFVGCGVGCVWDECWNYCVVVLVIVGFVYEIGCYLYGVVLFEDYFIVGDFWTFECVLWRVVWVYCFVK